MNDSSTGGYLLPSASPAPLEGQSFEDFLQQIIGGITGLDGQFIRPRWQPEPPNLPTIGADWFAFGIVGWDSDTYAVERHDPAANGSSHLQRHETVEILLSFYGPNASGYMAQFRDGIQISQNREILTENGMGHVETGRAISVPSLVKERWLFRIDMPWTIRRQIRRVYPVLNILSSKITTYTDGVPQIVSIINV